MAKKKNSRQKRQKDACDEDTSDDVINQENVKTCPHISKAINMGRMKKALKSNVALEKCMDCEIKPTKTAEDGEDSEVEVDVWLCLQCGHCGCGRNAPEQHAIKHYKTPRSDSHAIVVNTLSLGIWCYDCDDDISVETSRSIKECVDFISKNCTKKKTDQGLANGPVCKSPVLSSPEISATNENEKKEANKVENQAITKDVKSIETKAKSVVMNTRVIKGLRNLGNTCFFNAVMQNLCRTPWLLKELEERTDKSYIWEIPFPFADDDEKACITENSLRVTLPDCFILTQSFLTFLKQMNSQPNKSEVINPSQLFEQICKKAPQFRGFQQQDSHELLRHLLDGIRNEEIRRQKKGILKAFNLSEKVNPENVDDKTKHLIKAYGSYASHTIVEKIFGGQLISTVLCEECRMSSQVFEPFMDLSLPLAEEKPLRGGKVQKQPAAEVEDFGMYSIAKKKNNDTKLSKHQERKLKQQARKAAKKKAKAVKSEVSSEPVEESDDTSLLSLKSEDTENNSIKENCSEGELSDADVEDNDDSESVSNNPSVEKTAILHNDAHENSNECSVPIDDRIQELCNRITEIRIRRDSDKQEDLLDSLENSSQTVNKHQEKNCSTVEESDEKITDNWSHSQSEQQTKEWMYMSLSTVKPRYQPSSLECSVNSCLNQFTASELLTGRNKFRCENCTNRKQEATGDKTAVVYSNASKQMLIFSPPAVLTLHLKRFQQVCMSLRKLNLFVEFPLELDLAPYCSSLCLRLPHMAGVKDEILYSLYGIVQHSGKLTSGHYTAYVKVHQNHFNPNFLNNCPMGQCSLEQFLQKLSKVKPLVNTDNITCSDSAHKWYYISDSHFNEVSESEVLRSQAYILFYQRIK